VWHTRAAHTYARASEPNAKTGITPRKPPFRNTARPRGALRDTHRGRSGDGFEEFRTCFWRCVPCAAKMPLRRCIGAGFSCHRPPTP
jgi:hypothetical protein